MRLTISRREFLGSSAAATALGAVTHAHAGGSDVLRVGLIGCGGRGTGAASQALRADPAVKLVAMGDAFEDRLGQSLDTLMKDESRSWRSWAGWRRIPARSSPGSRRSAPRKTCRRRGTIGMSRYPSRP